MPVTHVPVSIAAATTAYTITNDESGSVFYIADLTADCTFTLPTPAAGLWYEFVYAGVAADTADWIISTGSGTNYFLGGLLYVDDAPAADSVASDGDSNDFMRVLTPEPGTRVRVECHNGVNWVASGVVASANAPTFADT